MFRLEVKIHRAFGQLSLGQDVIETFMVRPARELMRRGPQNCRRVASARPSGEWVVIGIASSALIGREDPALMQRPEPGANAGPPHVGRIPRLGADYRPGGRRQPYSADISGQRSAWKKMPSACNIRPLRKSVKPGTSSVPI